MGRPDVTKLRSRPEQFARFVQLHATSMRTSGAKVTCPERLTTAPARPMTTWSPTPSTWSRRFPDRVLWGTDWPHPNLKSHMPDDGMLVDCDTEDRDDGRAFSVSCWSTIRCALYWES